MNKTGNQLGMPIQKEDFGDCPLMYQKPILFQREADGLNGFCTARKKTAAKSNFSNPTPSRLSFMKLP